MKHTVALAAPRAAAPIPLRRRIALWLSVWSERRSLARLSDAALADIGVTRESAAHEARRPAWDIDRARLGKNRSSAKRSTPQAASAPSRPTRCAVGSTAAAST